MRNGQTPIHIQRWAPADFHADETVKLLKARRDYLKLTFYRTFLDESFMAGGDLPADPEALAAVMSMPVGHVKQALAFFVGLKLFEENGRLYQPRIRRDVAEELEFREVQRENGRKGGRRASQRLALPEPIGKPKDSPSPPAPIASALRLSPAPIATESGESGSDEPSPVASPALLTFNAQGKTDKWSLTQRQVDEWQKLYPALDVIACCRKAFAWAEANPAKRKTAKGMPAFLVNWLNREANSNRNGTGLQKAATSGTQSSYGISDETRARLEARQRKSIEESRRELEQPDPPVSQ